VGRSKKRMRREPLRKGGKRNVALRWGHRITLSGSTRPKHQGVNPHPMAGKLVSFCALPMTNAKMRTSASPFGVPAWDRWMLPAALAGRQRAKL